MSKLIYMDNAATTQVYPEVLDTMIPYFTEHYGNPSAIYSFAGEAKRGVDHARETIANVIGAKTEEIYFTGGGSESDNWALKATAEAYANKGKHIITTTIEHHAILHTAQWLEKKGYEITYVNVDEDGKVKLDELEAAIRPDTILISVMAANNEIGTIQPLKEIGAIARKHGVLFHTDAVQAFAHIPINVADMNIDMLSASGHKFHGPKGIGFLYVSNKVKIGSFIHGGSQERSRRAGTHNVPGIIVHDHFDKDIAGVDLALNFFFADLIAGFIKLILHHGLGGDLDIADKILNAAVFHHGHQIRCDFVFIAGIGMHNIPKCLIGLFFHFG